MEYWKIAECKKGRMGEWEKGRRGELRISRFRFLILDFGLIE
jgi:hypothetical protein